MRTTKVLSVTLPAPMLEAAQELARRENRTMSELVREALRSYAQQESEKRWEALAKLGAAAAKRVGVENEEDVVRVIHEFRQEKRS
jgi:metal-responsive CopG/Arc/MetJ family transcriptional regulator